MISTELIAYALAMPHDVPGVSRLRGELLAEIAMVPIPEDAPDDALLKVNNRDGDGYPLARSRRVTKT